MVNLYTRSEKADDFRLKNTSGVALVEGDLVVLGGVAMVANGVIAINAIGCFGALHGGFTMEAASTDLKTAEDTFATENQAVYFDSVTNKLSDTVTQGYYLIGLLQMDKDTGSSPDGGIVFITVQPHLVTLADANGDFAMGVATLTVAAAATPVPVIPAAQVPAGKKFYPLGFLLSVGGTTAWTDSTGTIVRLSDTADTPVVLVSFAKAQLTSQAQLGPQSTGVTLATPYRTGVGMTAAKGVSIDADSDFDAGSDITITLFGVIK